MGNRRLKTACPAVANYNQILNLNKKHCFFNLVFQFYSIPKKREEETNKEADKGKIASVYLNRIAAGQRLEADPTIKFALNNFGLKRIRKSSIDACAGSPFNTYFVKGLPPGPICTPSAKTIDAVLNAPKTDYLFFVAGDDGVIHFTHTEAEHEAATKLYCTKECS